MESKKVSLRGFKSIVSFSYYKISKRYKSINKKNQKNETLNISEQWIFDNYYIVKEAFDLICRNISMKITVENGVNTGRYKLPAVFYIAQTELPKCSPDDFIRTVSGSVKITDNEITLMPYFIMGAYITLISSCDDISLYSDYFNNLKNILQQNNAKLYESVSITHNLLMKFDEYKVSDYETRCRYREQAEKNAKYNAVSVQEYIKSISDKCFCKELDYHSRKRTDILYIASLYISVVFSMIGLIYITNSYLSLLLFLPVYFVIKNIINLIFLSHITPYYFPRLSKEISDNIKICHLIPILITGDDIYSKLEKAYLSNPDKNIFFGVVCDFPESDNNDSEDYSEVKKAIENLNKEYGNLFFAFIRKKVFSFTQNKYIGKERKRGAIIEVCNFIQNGSDNFADKFGIYNELRGIEYISVADADTASIRSISKLRAVIAHPSNSSGIIVPNIITYYNRNDCTLFEKITSNYFGTNSYDIVTANIFQDIFNVGIFSGKGIIKIKEYLEASAKIPEERILSHDFIEGALIGVSVVSDVKYYEEQPSSFNSFSAREHRWVRGDWQSTIMIKQISGINRYILFDNLCSNISVGLYPFILILFLIFNRTLFYISVVLLLIKIFYPILDSIAKKLTFGSYSIFDIRYSSKITSPIYLILFQSIFNICTMPYSAVNVFDAIIRGIFRQYISGRKLLEWTTASQSEHNKSRVNILPILISIVMLVVSIFTINIVGIILSCLWVAGNWANKLTGKRFSNNNKITDTDRKVLREYANDMWLFYSDFLCKEYNYLIPDNFQVDPPVGAALRTSPTNIGFSVLAVVDAYKMGIISKTDAGNTVASIFKTIEKLEKYKGHLYNWYDIKTLKPLDERYVSFVDSGNLYVCLLTACSILNNELPEVNKAILKIISQMDFSFLYNKDSNLFHVGLCARDNKLSESYYDIFASESRLSVFALVAQGVVDPISWNKMLRIPIKNRRKYGLKSWAGTVFEFLLPEIFISSSKNSLIYEALQFTLEAESRRVDGLEIPFGISEGCFYAFDGDFAYQYKAMGIAELGQKHGLNGDVVVSPYSSFLLLKTNISKCVENLQLLKDDGVYGKYGFYEGVDYKNNKVIKTYMSHHIGMSFTMLANILCDNINEKGFMSIPQVSAHSLLLDESINCNTISVKNYHVNYIKDNSEVEYFFDKTNPKGYTLSNGNYTTVMLDNGAGYSCCNGYYVTKYRRNIIDCPRGIFFVLVIDKKFYPVVSFSKEDVKVIGNDNELLFISDYPDFSCEIRISVLENCNAEIRDIKITNKRDKAISGKMLAYFEPVLIESESAHPAFNGLTVEAELNEKGSGIIFRNRKSGYCLCAGIVCDKSLFATLKDNVFPSAALTNDYDKINLISENEIVKSCANPVFYQQVSFELSGDEERNYRFILSTAADKKECESIFNKATTALIDNKNKLFERKIISDILPSLLFNIKTYNDYYVDINILWSYGISGNKSILLVNYNNEEDSFNAEPYLKIFMMLLSFGIIIDLVFLFAGSEGYNRPFYNGIIDKISEMNCEKYFNKGIYVVTSDNQNVLNVFRATASYIISEKKTDVKIKPMSVLTSKVSSSIHTGFSNNGFYINKNDIQSNVSPWCNILTNGKFGTVVSHNSLGYSYYSNSGLNKITRWSNDPQTDNYCEKLLLLIGKKTIDIIKSAHVFFTANTCYYYYNADDVEMIITVSVPKNYNCKVVDIDIINNKHSSISFFYYTDIMLGNDINQPQSNISCFQQGNAIYFQNGTNSYFPNCTAYLYCENAHKIGKSYIETKAKKGSGHIRFLLGAEKDKITAVNAEKDNLKIKYSPDCPFKIHTGVSDFDNFVNTFLYKQVLDCRLISRCGFYQASGAYGFRDQLQDAMAISSIDDSYLKAQILKCCEHQFYEGDVMHWWHENDNGGDVGVRTRCSDDLLWLPLALSDYIEKSQDYGIIDTKLRYLQAEPLKENEFDRFMKCESCDIAESIYAHCVRAIKRSMNVGYHGLMLIGSGDWNDGFSNVGIKGSGESVWLSIFYCCVINKFIPIIKLKKDKAFLANVIEFKNALIKAVEENGWDGKYYLRAFYDDGKAIGTSKDSECVIDIMPQIFALLADCFDKDRVAMSIESIDKMLLDNNEKLIRLFNGSFADGDHNPGYIKEYVAGVRENGGQYTHAVAFYAYALFRSGQADKGFEVLQLLNPAQRSSAYKNEPYVLSGDIYTADGRYGKGGWSWYTGSAGWYLKTVIEEMFGMAVRGDRIAFSPNMPSCISDFKFSIIVKGTRLNIIAKRDNANKLFENNNEIDFVACDKKIHNLILLF